MTHLCLSLTLYGDQCRNPIKRGKYCCQHRSRKIIYDDDDLIIVKRRRYRRKKTSCNEIGYLFYVLMFWPIEIIRLIIDN